jgi:hypothetical protein
LKDANHCTYFQLFSDTSFCFKDLVIKYYFKAFIKKIVIIFIHSSFNYFAFQNILFSDNEINVL